VTVIHIGIVSGDAAAVAMRLRAFKGSRFAGIVRGSSLPFAECRDAFAAPARWRDRATKSNLQAGAKS